MIFCKSRLSSLGNPSLFAANGLFLFLVSVGGVAEGSLLTPSGNAGTLEKISMPQSAQAQVEGESQTLTSLGFGLRAKKVVFVNVKVYLGQLFVSDIATFKKENPLKSLTEQKSVAVQMHFLRSVDGETVQKSFQDALKVNSVKLTDADVQQFLEVVKSSGEVKAGNKLTIVGARLPDGKEAILFENSQGQISEVKSGVGFIEKIFSIWLGKASDSGVESLKSALLKSAP